MNVHVPPFQSIRQLQIVDVNFKLRVNEITTINLHHTNQKFNSWPEMTDIINILLYQ